MSETATPLTPLFTARQIQQRVRDLAAEISAATPPGATIHLVGVLTGGFVFLADLARAFAQPVTIDFVKGSSYRSGTTSSGGVTWSLEPGGVAGKDVLVVEDIVDTGTTLCALHERLLSDHPRSLRCVSLLDKPARRQRKVPVDFVGFVINDVFVVGYGLDHAEQYRQLPFIAALPEP